MYKLLNLSLCILLSCLGLSVHADMPPKTSSQGWDAASQGYRNTAKVAILNASSQPSDLGRFSKQTQDELFSAALLKSIDETIALDKTRIFLTAVNRQIVLEKYASYWVKNSSPLGYSMSKSLTSMTIGKLMCKYKHINLDTKGAEILSEFSGTSWGNATLADVLKMSSGSSTDSPPHTGWHTENIASKHRGIYDGVNNLDLAKEMLLDDARTHQPGTSFQYNNYDTLFLGLIVEAVSKQKFDDFFNQEIWQEVKSQKTGGWLKSNKGTTYTAMGFSASPEDWIRIGYYVIDSLKVDDCFGDYLKSATQTFVKTHVKSLCYGYQIWNFCRPGVFHFWGFGGQHLVIAPGRNTVIYTHSAIQAEDTSSESNLFGIFGKIIQSIRIQPSNSMPKNE